MTSIFILIPIFFIVASLAMYTVFFVLSLPEDEEIYVNDRKMTSTTAEVAPKLPPPSPKLSISSEKVDFVKAEIISDHHDQMSNESINMQVDDSLFPQDVDMGYVIDPEDETESSVDGEIASNTSIKGVVRVYQAPKSPMQSSSPRNFPSIAKTWSISSLVSDRAKASKYTLQYQQTLIEQRALLEQSHHTNPDIANTPSLLTVKNQIFKLK